MGDELLNERSARVAIWKEASEYGLAWLKFGDERQNKLQIAARGTPQSKTYQNLMMAVIDGQLSSGELRAFGYRTSPTASDGPVPIPPDAFDQGRDGGWDDDVVEASGWRWERVRVFAPHATEPQTAPAITPPAFENESRVAMKRGGGRRDTYPFTEKVLEQIESETPSLIELPADKLWDHFKKAYDEFHGPVAKQIPAPKVRTLRDQLTRYRAAKTGGNWQ